MTRRLPSALALVAMLALGCAPTQDPSSSVALVAPVPEGPPRPPSGASRGFADGMLPAGATVYDDHPGVVRLDTRLLEELRAATADASAQGVGIVVNSGWRSKAYQSLLFEEAVVEHGTEAAAAAWVARPGTSVHESGAAVDLGPSSAVDWLVQHGADYGLCQVYDNEPWHFELDLDAGENGCPDPYDDPSDDPRLQM